MPTQPEELLRRWSERVPQSGADEDDVVAVMRHLGMETSKRSSGHLLGKHPKLIGSDLFPQGVVTVNCHAFGKQGVAHPAAIKDIVRAAKVIRGGDGDE